MTGGGDAAGVVRGSALLVAAKVIGNAGFFVAVLILTRALSIPDRGEFAFITTAAQLTAGVAGFGLTQALVVFSAQEPENRSRLLTNALLFAGASSLAVAGTFSVVITLVRGPHLHGLTGFHLVLLGAGAVASALAGAGNAFLIGCRRWRAQATALAAAPWFYALALSVTWTQTSLTIGRSLTIWVAYYFVWVAALLVSAIRASPLGYPSRALLTRSLRFGLRAWAGSLTQMLNFRADQIVMGFIASQAALGIYAVSVNASEILLILPEAAATVLLPVLARSIDENRTERTLRAFRVLSIASLAAMACFAAVGPVLLPLVFGSRYQLSVVPFLWLITGTIGFLANVVFVQALLASSSPGLASLAPMVSLGLGLGLDIALIPSLGPTGAAVAATAAFTTGGLVALFAFRTRAPFSYRLLVPVRDDLVVMRSAGMLLARPILRRRSTTGGS